MLRGKPVTDLLSREFHARDRNVCKVSDGLSVQELMDPSHTRAVAALRLSMRPSHRRGERQRDSLHESAAKRREAHPRGDRENRSKTERTEANRNAATALWTTVSGFESLPPSHPPSLTLARRLVGTSLGKRHASFHSARAVPNPCHPPSLTLARRLVGTSLGKRRASFTRRERFRIPASQPSSSAD